MKGPQGPFLRIEDAKSMSPSSMAPGIALATTLHDIEGRMAPFIRRYGPEIAPLFTAIGAVATHTTAEATIRSIEEIPNGAVARKPERWERRMGRGRRMAVAMAAQEYADFILHIDLDRLLHWIRFRKQELSVLLKERIPAHDFLIIGRSKRAFDTHPSQQTAPESITNDAISEALGWKVDVTSGCSSFRREVGVAVMEVSVSDDFGTTDTEWPLIARLRGFVVGSIETEGLEFETPDLHAGRIGEIGYRAWLEEIFGEAQLAYRDKLARASIEMIDATLAKYGRRKD